MGGYSDFSDLRPNNKRERKFWLWGSQISAAQQATVNQVAILGVKESWIDGFVSGINAMGKGIDFLASHPSSEGMYAWVDNRNFLINDAKGLLQQYRVEADNGRAWALTINACAAIRIAAPHSIPGRLWSG